MAECDGSGRSIVRLRVSLSTGIDGDPMARPRGGQGQPFLRDVEPKLLLRRPIRARRLITPGRLQCLLLKSLVSPWSRCSSAPWSTKEIAATPADAVTNPTIETVYSRYSPVVGSRRKVGRCCLRWMRTGAR